MENLKVEIGKVVITITKFDDESIMLEKNFRDRWFVSTQEKDGFYLQENLEDGEIVDMGKTDSFFDALKQISNAGH